MVVPRPDGVGASSLVVLSSAEQVLVADVRMPSAPLHQWRMPLPLPPLTPPEYASVLGHASDGLVPRSAPLPHYHLHYQACRGSGDSDSSSGGGAGYTPEAVYVVDRTSGRMLSMSLERSPAAECELLLPSAPPLPVDLDPHGTLRHYLDDVALWQASKAEEARRIAHLRPT